MLYMHPRLIYAFTRAMGLHMLVYTHQAYIRLYTHPRLAYTCTRAPGLHTLAHSHREALTQLIKELPGHICDLGLLL